MQRTLSEHSPAAIAFGASSMSACRLTPERCLSTACGLQLRLALAAAWAGEAALECPLDAAKRRPWSLLCALSSASWPGSELGPKMGRPLSGALHMLHIFFWVKLGQGEP